MTTIVFHGSYKDHCVRSLSVLVALLLAVLVWGDNCRLLHEAVVALLVVAAVVVVACHNF